ncbi:MULTISPECIES: DUF3618 domain-containing protein [unclassified Rhodococcus (in: high G+C Gram-positive bacteria)]|uniref:DUF3618 domain-containing protein n=1 Tax=unclassified Rhodococcus (in: high G+C Gram-positive bacteria) TaxID=192944 RepID=UPI00146D589F|nr:DUF3618 domain-containing protein [Rhodococcus sp. F64268]MCK0092331.1 DUF3618 domain-containing protein [Rhodococcus sp. F64268]NLU63077.1 DUF3618 domain-containing protein [Rhodococcus sp. HNM0563]
MARDTGDIERDIEKARNQLASTLDELSLRANPKTLVANTKQSVVAKVNQPQVKKYAAIAVGAVVGLLVLRKILR